MIWWTGQNLDQPIKGPDGTPWFFLVSHGHEDGVHIQRIFFWDDGKVHTGMVEWRGGDTLHIRRIKDRMRRIANDAEYRSQFLRPLEFPIQRHW